MLKTKLYTGKVGLIALFLLILTYTSPCKASKDLPTFYLASKSHQCPLDSPGPYYIGTFQKSLSATVTESGVFFEEFLDLLAITANNTNGYDASLESWKSIKENMPQNLDLAVKLINLKWEKLIATDETSVLPWEIKLHRAVILELLNEANRVYLSLDELVRTEIQTILVSLQGAIAKVVEKMKETKPDIGIGDSFTILAKSEELLEEVEPNFIGRLFTRVLRADRELKTKEYEGIFSPKPRTFLTEPLEQIQFLVETFKNRILEYPRETFWRKILKSAPVPSSDSHSQTRDQLSASYAQNEELITKTAINILLSGNQ